MSKSIHFERVVRCLVFIGLLLSAVGGDANSAQAASEALRGAVSLAGLQPPLTPAPTVEVPSATPTLLSTVGPDLGALPTVDPVTRTPATVPVEFFTVTPATLVTETPTATVTPTPTETPTPTATPTETATEEAVQQKLEATQPMTDTAVIQPEKGGQHSIPGLGITITIPSGAFKVPVRLSAEGLDVSNKPGKLPESVSLGRIVRLEARQDTGGNGVPFGGGSDNLGQDPQLPAPAATAQAELIDRFDKAVELTIDVTDLVASRGHAQTQIWIGYFDEKNQEWKAVDYTTAVTEDGRTLATVLTDHFSTWGFGSNISAGWVPVFSEPNVSLFSGAATYSYPIEVPAGRGGLAPDLALSYGSRAVDGLAAWSQGGEVGFGWDISAPMITRDWSAEGAEASCSWGIFRLQLGGMAYTLVKGSVPYANAPYVRYYTLENSGLYIERHNRELGGASAPNVMGEYWIVRTPDGKTYRMGWMPEAELIVRSGTNCNRTDKEALTYAGAIDGFPAGDERRSAVAIMWHTDRVWDSHGNYVKYQYTEEKACQWTSGGTTTYSWYEKASYPVLISYNRDVSLTPIGATGLPSDWNNEEPRWYNTQIALDLSTRGAINGSQSDMLSSGCGSSGIPRQILHQNQYISAIRVHQGGVMIRKYLLGYEMQNNPTDGTRLLKSIQVVGKDGTSTLPATTFSYTKFQTKSTKCGYGPNCGIDGNGDPIPNTDWDKETFQQSHLTEVNNGYGGRTQFDYTADNDISSGNVSRAYRVTERRIYDGIHATAARVTYQYDGPCFRSSSAPVYVSGQPWAGYVGFIQSIAPHGCPNPSPLGQTFDLAGYKFAVSKVYDYNGTVIAWENHSFNTSEGGAKLVGRDAIVDTLSSDGTQLLARQINYYFAPAGIAGRGADVYYVRPYEVHNLKCTGSVSAPTCYGSKKQFVSYDTNENLLRTDEYLSISDSTPYRGTTTSYYNPDPTYATVTNAELPNWIADKTVWLIGLLKAVATWSGTPDNNYTDRITSYVTFEYDQRDVNGTPNGWNSMPIRGDLIRVQRYNWSGTDWPSRIPTQADWTWYDGFGNPNKLRNITSRGIDLTWDASIGRVYPVYMTNTQGHAMSAGYDFQLGKLTSVTDENNQVTSYTFDTFGRLKQVFKPGDGADPSLEYFYYDTGATQFLSPVMIAISPKRTTYANAYAQRYFYDGLGRLVQQHTSINVIPSGYSTAQDIIQSTGYDALGHVISQTVPYAAPAYVSNGTSPYTTVNLSTAAKALTTFDGAGRPLKITTTDSTWVEHHYGVFDTANGPRFYDDLIDANRHRTQQQFDMLGRMVTAYEMQGDCSSSYWTPTYTCSTPYTTVWTGYANTYYAYNQLDAMTSVTDNAGNVTAISYNHLGQKTAMVDPDMGAWSYAYDGAGNLTRQTDAKNQTTCLYYDNISRLTGKLYQANTSCPTSNPSLSVTFGYDSGTNGIGRRTSMSDSSGSTTWSYDLRGRMTEELRTIGVFGTYKTQWNYDLLDRLSWMKYPGDNQGNVGEQVTYTYHANVANWLVSVVGTNTYVKNVAYDVAGRVDLLSLGLIGSSPIFNVDYVYNAWTTQGGRLQQTKTGTPSSTTSLQDLRYTYDSAGNVLTIQDYKAGSPQTQTFTYDFLNRLKSAQASGGTGGTYALEYYTVNEIGNLTAKGSAGISYPATTPGGCSVGTLASKPHAASGSTSNPGTNTYTYDCNGNVTARNIGGTTFTLAYDNENRLTDVTGGGTAAKFGYNGDGERVSGQLTTGGATTVYVGNYYEATGSAVKTYYYAGSLRVAMRDGSTLKFLVGDHLGSTSLTVDTNAVRISEVRYKPWGETRYTYGTTTTTYRFTGQRQESALGGSDGLYFYNARWYDPTIGRFTSPDTIVPGTGNPQALNRFSYVYNNPMGYVDPSGHFGCIVNSGVNVTVQQCIDWFNQVLDDLAASGATGANIVAQFRELDHRTQVCTASGCSAAGVTIQLLEGDGGGTVLPGTTTIGLGGTLAQKTRGTTGWNAMLGVVGHEMMHLAQWSSERVTAQGEIKAYIAQGDIYNDLNLPESQWPTRDVILAAQKAMAASLAVEETMRFRVASDVASRHDWGSNTVYNNEPSYPLPPIPIVSGLYYLCDQVRWLAWKNNTNTVP